ncbi:sterol glucosyltransferase [Xylariales sp. PMI_506]|nr:sterol glucosyltransferase [Xylariales sp. PMI_506]
MLEDATKVNDDGRIEVNLTPTIYKRISCLIPERKEPLAYEQEEHEDHPPSYDDIAQEKFATLLNIVIQVVGSRGDVQPFIALGTQLQRHGHRVRLATHDVFRDFVHESSALEFFPIGGDPADLMAYMVKNPGLIPNMKSLRAGDIQRKRKMVATMLDGCWRSCIEPDPETGLRFVADAIIANPPSFAHIHCAEALAIPVHLMFTMPWSPTRAYPHPLADIKIKSAGVSDEAANYLSHVIVEWMTWQGLGDVINKWRETIDLEPVPFSEGPSLVATQKIPFTYCWSPALVPKAFDWPAHIDVCGFFFRDVPTFTPNESLQEFLADGPPPVYFGFGSIVIDDPSKLTSVILDAVKKTGVRALISRGWSKLGLVDGQEINNKDIMLLDDCPHEWLFQHVAAVVHHGGAGTTACGLRFGIPTTIVPFFGDQPFWGKMVAAAGAGPDPIQHRALNSENLTEAVRFCLRPEALAAAKEIAEKMQRESGVRRAVQSFHAQLPMTRLRCDLLPDQPAVWRYRSRRQNLKLSKLACEVLKEHLIISPTILTLYEKKSIVIEPQRWDPVTSTTSATIELGFDVTKAMVDIIAKPVKVFQRASSTPSRGTTEEMIPVSKDGRSDHEQSGRWQSHPVPANVTKNRSCAAPFGPAAIASISSFGNFIGLYTKGIFVDVPLATVEGLRAVPRLYGREIRDYGPISSWQSGAGVAGKHFAYGITEGIMDLFMEPIRGGQEEGAFGVAKGLGKGLLSAGTKIPSAGLGLVAYTGQGVYKSVRAKTRTKTRNMIRWALEAEGQHLLKVRVDRERLVYTVLEIFESSEGTTVETG